MDKIINIPETYNLTPYKANLLIDMYEKYCGLATTIPQDLIDLVVDIDNWKKCIGVTSFRSNS